MTQQIYAKNTIWVFKYEIDLPAIDLILNLDKKWYQ